ncbi:MAG: flagellar biosynthetic protein FliO [bacterium]|nr:flagellar biosynthetic protein FliO [bacterium]
MRAKICLFITLVLTSVNTFATALPAQDPSRITQGELTRVILGLGLVVFIILSLSWLVKRLNKVNLGFNKGYETIATMILGPKEKMMLFKIGGRYLLMGVGSASVNLIYDFGTELPEGFEFKQKATFAELLKSAARKS